MKIRAKQSLVKVNPRGNTAIIFLKGEIGHERKAFQQIDARQRYRVLYGDVCGIRVFRRKKYGCRGVRRKQAERRAPGGPRKIL